MQEKQSIKQKILQFIDCEEITRYQFYKATDITRGVLDQSSGMSEENIQKFLFTYPEISPIWLLTGEGEMFKNVKPSNFPTIDYDNVKRLLAERGIDLKELTNKIGVTDNGFRKSIREETISLRRLKRFCEVVEVNPLFFFGSNDTKRTKKEGNENGDTGKSKEIKLLRGQIKALTETIKSKDEIIELLKKQNK